jgi:hypothetical protein
VIDVVVTATRIEYDLDGPYAATQVYRLEFEKTADYIRWVENSDAVSMEVLVAKEK